MHNLASPISSTRPTKPTNRTGARAFTLVEVMVAMGIGSFVLTGAITTFLMVGRVVENTGNYCDLDANARRGLETFSREARIASNVTFYSSTKVILTILDSTTANTYPVTYECILDPDQTTYPGQHAFVRNGPPLTAPFANPPTDSIVAGSTNTTLIHNVNLSSFSFNYYDYIADDVYNNNPYNAVPDNKLTIPADNVTGISGIRQIELTLTAQRASSTVVNATNAVLSARFILRNKS
jgi:prepilin-type N-terminal cleavage/methylation domain-containing protein